MLGDGEPFAGAPESVAVFVTLGIADDLAFKRSDGVLQMVDITSFCSKTDCHTTDAKSQRRPVVGAIRPSN